MREQLALFFTALGYFTRLPVPARVAWSPQRLSHAVRYFPLVGWVVGAVGAASLLALAAVLPASLAVILSMAATIRLTGALHEDGFADACDGLGGGWDKAQVLAIMKDSHVGSYGAIGIVLMLLAKAAALVELAAASPAAAAVALCVAHPLSRLAAAGLIHLLPYARTDGSAKSSPLARPLAPVELALAAVSGLLPLALLAPAEAACGVFAAIAVTAWAGRLFMRRLGGYTGDLLGATQQMTELSLYLVLISMR